jgi:hypothetical protein
MAKRAWHCLACILFARIPPGLLVPMFNDLAVLDAHELEVIPRVSPVCIVRIDRGEIPHHQNVLAVHYSDDRLDVLQTRRRHEGSQARLGCWFTRKIGIMFDVVGSEE